VFQELFTTSKKRFFGNGVDWVVSVVCITTMKIVKKCISLPEEVFSFAEKEAAKLAKERGSHPNVSGYIRELLAEKKRQMQQLPKAA
jgi:hypothetical protein